MGVKVREKKKVQENGIFLLIIRINGKLRRLAKTRNWLLRQLRKSLPNSL